jgi:hypothetical protein
LISAITKKYLVENPPTNQLLSIDQTATDIMPKSLEKTRKKISKKKGNINALHENSRDSQRLRRALMRDDKLIRVASARRKNDQPLSESACPSLDSET